MMFDNRAFSNHNKTLGYVLVKKMLGKRAGANLSPCRIPWCCSELNMGCIIWQKNGGECQEKKKSIKIHTKKHNLEVVLTLVGIINIQNNSVALVTFCCCYW